MAQTQVVPMSSAEPRITRGIRAQTPLDHLGKVAPFLIALPMAVFGVQHFIYLSFVANFIPAWIPFRTFWACFTGIALIAAAIGIIFRIWKRVAATLLGTMILLWVLLLHTSRIAAQPTDFGEWRGIFQALAMSGCAFALAASVRRNPRAPAAPPNRFVRSLNLLSEAGGKWAPYFVGVGIAALGLEHFIFVEVSAPQVPVWIPGTVLGNYLSGAALIACGLGLFFPKARRHAALGLALMVFTSMLVFHLPVVLRAPRFESDWTKTLVLSGGAILLAGLSKTSPRTPLGPKR